MQRDKTKNKKIEFDEAEEIEEISVREGGGRGEERNESDLG